jgi:hypothetical protein
VEGWSREADAGVVCGRADRPCGTDVMEKTGGEKRTARNVTPVARRVSRADRGTREVPSDGRLPQTLTHSLMREVPGGCNTWIGK